MFPPIKPGGYAVNAALPSADMNKFDQQLQNATDHRYNPDWLGLLNVQRYVDVLPTNLDFHDVVWDPVAKKFLLVGLADLGGGIETFIKAVTGFWDDDFAVVSAIHTADFAKGGEYSSDLVVFAELDSGSGRILRGDSVNGFDLATTPPGIATSRPIYAWDTDTWVVGAANAAYLSTDDADNWAAATTPLTGLSVEKRTTPATDGTRIIIGDENTLGGGTTSYWYSDDGDTWTAGTLPAAVEEAQMAYDPSSGLWFCAGKVPGFEQFRCFASDDRGVTFVQQSQTAFSAGARVMAFGVVSKLVIAGLLGGQCFASDDNGASWVPICPQMVSTSGNVAQRTRILSGPFGPNMLISFSSNSVGTSPYKNSVFATLRNRLR